ncbi:MAG: PaaI family thioesterase [Culturomica sp.]|jgi:1,4-dihydroxy-2-naphthoyl-CoA hydrolase|nr:PaaI family thioesterase [Culturomica sp.]
MEKNFLEYMTEICKNTVVANLGMEFIAVGEDWLEIRMPLDHRTCRPDGSLHGGSNLVLAETAGGALSMMSLPEEMRYNSYGIEVNGNHVRRAEGSYVIGRSTFIHKGKRTHIMQVDIRDEYGKLVTVSRVTNIIV